MKRITLLIMFVALLAVSMACYAETGQKRASDCEPRSEVGVEKANVITNIVVASVLSDLDQPCYVGGKMAKLCSRLKPYYNAFSDECYSTLQECKKADGDLASAPGQGGCVRCGK